MLFSSSAFAGKIPASLKKAGFGLLLFLGAFIPFRTPLSDLTVSAVKAIPDILILALFIWYAVAIRGRFRLLLQDWLFLGFEALALVSTVLVNQLPLSLFIYQTRSIAVYYVLYFVIRNFGFGKNELERYTRFLQLVSLPLFALALVEKISSKTILFNMAVTASLDKANFGRLYSMFYNPNTYGMFLIFVIFLSLWMLYLTGRKTPLWLYVTLFTALYMTMSRSSIIILAAVLAVMVLLAWRSGAVTIRWKKLLLSCAIIAVSAGVIFEGTSFAATKYFYAIGQYKVVNKLSQNQQAEVGQVTYLDPQGNQHTGYAFYGVTYVDEQCTKPLSEYGSVVYVDNKEYILTKEGGKLLSEFNALSESEQQALLDSTDKRDDAVRDNSVLQNIQNSFDVNTSTRFEDLKDSAMYSSHTNGRLYSVTKAFELAADHPFTGTGFGTYGSSASLTWEPTTYETYDIHEGFYADNQYSCVLAETGFTGLLLFLGFLAATLICYRKNLMKVLACVIIGWFGLFYNILEVQIGAMLLWSILSFHAGDGVTVASLLRKSGDAKQA